MTPITKEDEMIYTKVRRAYLEDDAKDRLRAFFEYDIDDVLPDPDDRLGYESYGKAMTATENDESLIDELVDAFLDTEEEEHSYLETWDFVLHQYRNHIVAALHAHLPEEYTRLLDMINVNKSLEQSLRRQTERLDMAKRLIHELIDGMGDLQSSYSALFGVGGVLYDWCDADLRSVGLGWLADLRPESKEAD